MQKSPALGLNRFGFTLIELMIVITVMSVLATIALYGLSNAQASARDAARQQIMNGMQTALQLYFRDNLAYPNTGNDWASLICTLGGSALIGNVMCMGTNKYIDANPVDPKKDCTQDPAATWQPCNLGANPSVTPTYSYGSPDNIHCTGSALPDGYQLTLKRESGGVNYFCSPQ